MQLKLPLTIDSDFAIDCASISSFFSDNSDFPEMDMDLPIIDVDFSEYMWMENLDEFDKEVMQQLEEEALAEECMEAMLEEEEEEKEDTEESELRDLRESVLETPYLTIDTFNLWLNDDAQIERAVELCDLFSFLRMDDKKQLANRSTLNPNAAEFVPQHCPSDFNTNKGTMSF